MAVDNRDALDVLRIREIRQAIKPRMTLQALADKTGLEYTAISRYERGERWPSPDKLKLIADALNVPVYRLFLGTQPVPVDEEVARELATLTREQALALLSVIKTLRD